jgi:hypothetical protein
MPEQSDYQEAREAMARREFERTIAEARLSEDTLVAYTWDELPQWNKSYFLEFAEILLHLTYSDGSPMLAVLAKDQTVPENPYFNRHRFDITESAFTEGQQSLANFRRIAKEE